MIPLGSHGHYFWNPRVMHFLHSKCLPRDYKTCVALTFGPFIIITGGFQNEKFIDFCEKLGIFHNFSAPKTPQRNGVVERKNRSLEELARIILSEFSLPKYF